MKDNWRDTYDQWKTRSDRDDMPSEEEPEKEELMENKRVNMRAQAPDFVKDENGDAWGTEIETGYVRLDYGGLMIHSESGWEYQMALQEKWPEE